MKAAYWKEIISTTEIPMLKKIILSLAAFVALGAQAGVVQYNTRAAYDAATGSSSTLIDFEAQATSSATYYGSSLTVGDVTFTDNAARLFVLAASYYGTAFTSHYLNNNSEGSQITIQFATPVYSFALDLGTIYNWSGGSLQETFNFAGESITVDLAGQLYNSGTSPLFIGFTSTEAFSSITINDPTSGLAIDNFSFTTKAGELPEPASVALVGLALLGCGVARKRRAG
jgi:hypothetical protein